MEKEVFSASAKRTHDILLLLSIESLQNMLREAYVCNENQMGAIKSMVENYEISRLLVRQLIEHLLVPSTQTTFIKDIELARQDTTNFKSTFFYFAAALTHLYYAKREESIGAYYLNVNSKPVFYSGPNEPLSYIWLNIDMHGMVHEVQHYFKQGYLPNTLSITVNRACKIGDMLPLKTEVVLSGDKDQPQVRAYVLLHVNLDLNHVSLKRFDLVFLCHSLAILLTSGAHHKFVSVMVVCAPECDLRQIPVSLHSTP